jgi:hypothetical protein
MWCVTWSVTLREGYIASGSLRTVMKRILGPKRAKITRSYKLYNRDLHRWYYSQNAIIVIYYCKIRFIGYVDLMKTACTILKPERSINNKRNCFLVSTTLFIVDCVRILPLKTESNKLLGSPRHIWQENIKMDNKEMGFEVLDGVI